MDIGVKRHSFSHILAQAVKDIYGNEVKMAIGPAIENGFYYDFDFGNIEFKETDLKDIEKKMKQIIKQNQKFENYELSYNEAKKYLSGEKENYKLEMLEDLKNDGNHKMSFYKNVNQKGEITFVDMCSGPHVDNTNKLNEKAFKLDKVAGAYWKGDANNKMLTRIYGLAFDSREKLDNYIKMREEAIARDHRNIGPKMGLYTIDPDVGIGLPLWKPAGAHIVNKIKRWFEDEQIKRGYVPVLTPHIGRKNLWETSGHWGFYNESMYPPIELGQTLEDYQDNRKPKETEIYLLKPMNCPFHIKIFNSDKHSYRELPIKYYEFGTVYRYEQKGELGGLTRVRGFTQDDAHIICSKDDLEKEFDKVVDFSYFVLETFGYKIKPYLSLRDSENKEKYLGDDEMWDIAENTIRKILQKKGLDFIEEKGEAAFYGPKMDLKVEDSLGRSWQLSTVQFDFNLPEKFDVSFTNASGEEEKPFIIHRALLGSLERFMGILIEHFGGSFPLWLSPRQVTILAVNDKFIDYAKKVNDKLKENGFLSEIDYSGDSLNKKVRNAEKNKSNYILIIGEEEEKNKTVSVRNYKTKKQEVLKLDDFLENLINEEKNKTI